MKNCAISSKLEILLLSFTFAVNSLRCKHYEVIYFLWGNKLYWFKLNWAIRVAKNSSSSIKRFFARIGFLKKIRQIAKKNLKCISIGKLNRFKQMSCWNSWKRNFETQLFRVDIGKFQSCKCIANFVRRCRKEIQCVRHTTNSLHRLTFAI